MSRSGAKWVARLALLLVAAGLTACMGRGREVGPTLADLPERVVEPAAEQPLRVDRSRAIAAYREYLRETDSDDPLYAQGLQRLGDLMQAELDERDALAVGDPRVLPPSEAEREEVARIFRILLENYPQRPDNAVAWYQLARSEESLGNLEGALLALTALTEAYPQTERIDEIHFRRGEYSFALRDFAAAERAYAQVLALGAASEFREQALYKRGWSLFRLQDYPAALDMFVAVLDRHELDADGDLSALDAVTRQRVEDTLDVIALDFSYQQGTASIAPYFAGIGGRPWEVLVYTRLGEQYLEQQRYTDAAGAFNAFALTYPLARRAPYLLLRSIAALEQGGFERQGRAADLRLLADYGMDQPYWQRWSRAQEAGLVEEIRQRVDAEARYHHARAQAARPRERGAQDVAAAIDWYRKRIAWFSEDEGTAQANFLLAELLYENRRDREAVAEFERTAYHYPGHAKAAEAGYAALLAYERATPTLPAEARAGWRAAGIASALRFAARFREDPRAPAVMLRSAQDLFADGQAVPASEVAADLLRIYPALDAGIAYGAHLILGQEAFDGGRFAVAEAAFSQALQRLPAQDARRADLLERLAVSVYRQGEAEREAGRLGLAAGHFLRIASLAPASRIRANAEFDAAAVLLQDRQWQLAADQLEGFRQRFPGHALQAQVGRQLAVAYLESSQWLKAALEFEALATAAGSSAELRREARWQAAELFDKAGERVRAINAWAAYVRNHQQPVEAAMEARFRLTEIFRAAGDRQSLERWQKAMIAADARAGAARTDRTRYLAGTAQLELARNQVERFRGIRLVAPIRRNIERKRDAMQASLEALGEAAGYGLAAVTTEATYLTAEVYHGFGRDLMQSERPKDLDEEALEEYELLLEEQAYPFEEKAIQAHALNAGRTREGVYDQWVRQSFEQLARLMPARYAKEERSAGVMAQLD